MKSILLWLLTLNVVVLTSQDSPFEPGSITLINGDVKEGFIKNGTPKENGLGIDFKGSRSGEELYFGRNDIISYNFHEGDLTYRKERIKLYDDYLRTYSEEERFGEVLLHGDVELIRYFLTKDDYNPEIIGSRNYLYTLRRDSTVYQLDLFRSVETNLGRKVSNAFQNVISAAFPNCRLIRNESKNASFKNDDIIRLIRLYDECGGGLSINSSNRSNIPTASLNNYISIGINLMADDDFENYTGFFIGYQGDLSFSKHSRSITIQFGSGIIYQNFDFILGEDISQLMLETTLRLNISLKRTKHFYVGLGFGAEVFNAIHSDTDFRDTNNYLFLTPAIFLEFGKMKLDFCYLKQPGELIFNPDSMYAIRASYRLK